MRVGVPPARGARRDSSRGVYDPPPRAGTSQVAVAGLALGDYEATHRRIPPDPRARYDLLVHGGVRPGLSGPQAAPGEFTYPPGQCRGEPVDDARRALPVGGPQQHEAAGFQGRHEPVEDQFDVPDPFEQAGAVHDVERARRKRHGAQIAERERLQVAARFGDTPGERVVLIDADDPDVEAGRAQPRQAEVADVAAAPGLEQADLATFMLMGVVMHRAHEHFGGVRALREHLRALDRGRILTDASHELVG